MVLITSKENMGNIERVQEFIKRITNPTTSPRMIPLTPKFYLLFDDSDIIEKTIIL